MANVNVLDILNKVFGVRGAPFPGKPLTGNSAVIANGFEYNGSALDQRNDTGTPIRQYTDEALGRYEFLPATIDGIEIPNALVIITGEKSVVETDIVDVGTVFEKVFTKPYSITIIATLVGENGEWPGTQLKEMVTLWNKEDLVTLKCALTDYFIQDKNNLVITNISILDAEGAENVEVIQFDGRSNIDFELELI
jgi:hypothetical protein